VKEGWEGVVEQLKKVAGDGYELGGSLCLMHKGERVVDIVFGWEDRSFKEKYSNDTIQIIFSSTKVVESIAMAMLVDRGLISYNDKISKYWPEFAQAGKQDVSLGDLMSHAGGVAGNFPRLLTSDDIKNDRDGKESPLAEILAETPLDETCFRQKGTQGYHALSRGLFARQIMRRVDPKKRSMDQFVREEIVEPMNLDFRIGLTKEEDVERNGKVQETPWWRGMFGMIPRFILPKWLTAPFFNDIFLNDIEIKMMKSFGKEGSPGSNAVNRVFAGALNLESWGRSAEWRHIESPSTHGYSNGQTLARIAQTMSNKGTDPWTGTKLMSEKTYEIATKFFPRQTDSVLLTNTKYSVGGFGTFEGYPEDCIGWGGAGGSLIQWCPGSDVSIGYVMNYYSPHGIDWRGVKYLFEGLAIANNQ